MKNKAVVFTYCILNAFLLSHIAQARNFGDGLINSSDSKPLLNSDGRNSHWNGIGKLTNDSGASCTASLIDTRGPLRKATGPAYLLTSGHCVFFGNGISHTNESFKATITFNYFNDTPNRHKSYKVHKAHWSSMVGSDLAIVELESSLDVLIQDGIQPLVLEDHPPTDSGDILIVGHPSKFPEPGLRISACTQELAQTIIEQPWVHRNALKNRCKDIRPGSSGSPILDRNTNKILSVVSNSTYNSNAENMCFRNTPCEVRNGQPYWAAASNYSFSTNHLPACFVNGIFDISAMSCTLDPLFSIHIKEPWMIQNYVRANVNESGDISYPRWNLKFSADTPYYRYKSTRDAMDCESPNGYSHVIRSKDAHIIETIGPETGIHMLCIIGVESANQTPSIGLMKKALTLATQLAAPGPTPLPRLDISLGADWNYRIKWFLSDPQIAYTYYHAGPADNTDCGGTDDKRFTEVFDSQLFTAEQLPIKFCSYVEDLAGQPSAVREDLLALP